MVSLVATLTLAAERCPSRSEGFAFAILLSIINFATTVADLVGSFIYDHVFTRNLAPLILVSATCTAFAFVLVPLLHLGETRSQYLLAIPASELMDFDKVIMSGRLVARRQRRKSHIGRGRVPFG